MTKALFKNKKIEHETLIKKFKDVIIHVGSNWVFTMKYQFDGSIKRYEAYLVAKSFTQIYGIGYYKIIASVAKLKHHLGPFFRW